MSAEAQPPGAPDLTPRESKEQLLRVCAVLESVASRYAPSTSEHQAIRDAALAYITVHQRGTLLSAYRRLKAAQGGEITPEMAAKLRSHGIDPDALEADDTSSRAG